MRFGLVHKAVKPLLQDLEVNVVRHCNLACISCNHGSPLAKREWMDVKVFKEDVGRLSNFAHWEMCMIQGGEPTLRDDLGDFMAAINDSDIADNIGLLTNGTLLRRKPDSFWHSMAFWDVELRVSIYPVLPADDLEFIKQRCAAWNIKFFANPPYTHFMKMFKKHEDGGQAVWDSCPWKRCWTVHNGYLYFCPPSAFFPEQFPEMYELGYGVREMDPVKDGWPIAGFDEETIPAMLRKKNPLETCAICVGHGTERVEWGQTRNREEWIKASTV